jgi:hypothetical protein
MTLTKNERMELQRQARARTVELIPLVMPG